MVVAMGLSAIVTIPMASRYAQAKVQQIAASGKGQPTRAPAIVMPIFVAAIGSLVVGMVAGFAASRLLPPADPPARRVRRVK